MNDERSDAFFAYFNVRIRDRCKEFADVPGCGRFRNELADLPTEVEGARQSFLMTWEEGDPGQSTTALDHVDHLDHGTHEHSVWTTSRPLSSVEEGVRPKWGLLQDDIRENSSQVIFIQFS